MPPLPCHTCPYRNLFQQFAKQVTELGNEPAPPELDRESLKPWVYPDAIERILEIEAQLKDLKFIINGKWDDGYGRKKDLLNFILILVETGYLKKLFRSGKPYKMVEYARFFSHRYGHDANWLDGMAKKFKPQLDDALASFCLVDFEIQTIHQQFPKMG